MISVEDALGRILAAMRPLPAEEVALTEALGRVLADPVVAPADQPPRVLSASEKPLKQPARMRGSTPLCCSCA